MVLLAAATIYVFASSVAVAHIGQTGQQPVRSEVAQIDMPECYQLSSAYDLQCFRVLGAFAKQAIAHRRCDVATKVLTVMLTLIESTMVRNDRGACYGELRNYNAALKDFDAVLKTNPNDPVATGRRTQVLLLTERLKDALKSANRLLALLPSNADAWMTRAAIYNRMGKLAESKWDTAFANFLRSQPAPVPSLMLVGR